MNGSVEVEMTGVQRLVRGFQLPQFSLKKLHKNEKGLTLIELLAVIVILAIIAAIAVPSITGIIGKTKKESHRANAQLIIDAARYKITVEDFKPDGGTGDTQTISLKSIVADGFLEKNPVDPQGNGTQTYDEDATIVKVVKAADEKSTYSITLKGVKTQAYFTDEPEATIRSQEIGKVK